MTTKITLKDQKLHDDIESFLKKPKKAAPKKPQSSATSWDAPSSWDSWITGGGPLYGPMFPL